MCGLELREVGVARVCQLTARLLKIKLSVGKMIPLYSPGAGMTFKEMEAARRTALREKLHALNSALTTHPRSSAGRGRVKRRTPPTIEQFTVLVLDAALRRLPMHYSKSNRITDLR
jgi:hypothetical protein